MLSDGFPLSLPQVLLSFADGRGEGQVHSGAAEWSRVGVQGHVLLPSWEVINPATFDVSAPTALPGGP